MSRELKIGIIIILVTCLFSAGWIVISQHSAGREANQVVGIQDGPSMPSVPTPPQLSDVCTPTSEKVAWKTKDIHFTSDKPDMVVDTIYQAIDPGAKVHLSKSDDQHGLWWVTKDNWNIVDASGSGFFIAFPVDSYCPRADIIRYPIFQDLNTTISDILLKNGFVKNKQNSSASEDDEMFYDYILGFEKGDTRCVLETNSEISSDGTIKNIEWHDAHYRFICADQVDKNYAEQLPFLKGLDDHDAVVSIQKILGDFARISYSYRRGGLYAIMMQSKGRWIPIIKSQEQPYCSTILKYHIPVEIYGSPASQYIPSGACFDDSGSRMLAYPNGPPLGGN